MDGAKIENRGGARQGAGRPPVENPRRNILSVALTNEEVRKIKEAAKAENKLQSEYVRNKILAGL